MLTPLQLQEIYYNTVKELNPTRWQDASEEVCNNDVEHILYLLDANKYPEVNENSSLSNEQWQNLVDVCRTIKANENRFLMDFWHDERDCGTSHCLAGWAVSRYMNDPNFDEDRFDLPEFVKSYDFSNWTTLYGGTNVNALLGTVLLSEYISPFFYQSETEDEEDSAPVIMKNLIDVVLAEAQRDGTVVDNPTQKPSFMGRVKNFITGIFS
jgi:hypothetical protein